MQRVIYSIVTTDCPKCGQSVLKVIRRFEDRRNPHRPDRVAEECMACQLRVPDEAAKRFLIQQWRLQWQWAGGRLSDMPDCLRQPGDSTNGEALAPVAAKVHKPGGKPRPSFPMGTSWKPVTREQPIPPPSRLPIRVLWALHNLNPEGSQRAALNIIRHTRHMKHTVFAQEPGKLLAAFCYSGATIASEFQPAAYDLVVLNTAVVHSLIPLCKAEGVKPLWYIHEESPAPWMSHRQFEEETQWVKRVIFAAEHQRKSWENICDAPVAVIPTVIPPLNRPPGPTAHSEKIRQKSRFVILSFGMREPRKGQTDITTAVEGQRWKTLLIHGELNPFEYLAAADVYVASSRYETYNLSVQEAKAFRLPVIATNIPAHRTFFDHGVNGFLYEPGDTGELRRLLKRLQAEPGLAAELGRAPINGPTWADNIGAIESLFLSDGGAPQAQADELTVVYHIASLGDHWKDVVAEQLDQLARAGLRRVFVTHVGEGLDWILAEGHRQGMELVCTFHDERVTHYERPALELIERLSFVGTKPIMYLHSKGVSHPRDDTFWHEWRRMCTDALVDDWRYLVRCLDEYDAAGVNWWNAEGKWHFSGNMWLAHPRWLRQLPQFGRYYRDRFSCETWIGSVPGCKAKSLLCSDARFWMQERTLFWELRKAQQEGKLARIDRQGQGRALNPPVPVPLADDWQSTLQRNAP